MAKESREGYQPTREQIHTEMRRGVSNLMHKVKERFKGKLSAPEEREFRDSLLPLLTLSVSAPYRVPSFLNEMRGVKTTHPELYVFLEQTGNRSELAGSMAGLCIGGVANLIQAGIYACNPALLVLPVATNIYSGYSVLAEHARQRLIKEHEASSRGK